jgi:alpha-beta hydrolase superfamily lysophospholipase
MRLLKHLDTTVQLFLRFTGRTYIALSFLALAAGPAPAAEKTMPNLHKLDQPAITAVLFHPRSAPAGKPPAGATDLDIAVDSDVTIGCRLFSAGKDAPVILFFHGNGEIVQDYNDIGPLYVGQGLNFLIADYRGYGWSSGRPSATALINDARVIYREAVKWLAQNGYTGKIFIMGRSLGSACAIDLATRYNDDIGGLIIESGFADSLPLALTLGIDLAAMGITEDDGFNNTAKIAAVTRPTYILHGQRDTLIPLWHAEKLHLASGAKSKDLQIVPGADHNSIIAVTGIMYFQAIRGFVDRVTGAGNWRERRKAHKR